jgi:hypothetical protein
VPWRSCDALAIPSILALFAAPVAGWGLAGRRRGVIPSYTGTSEEGGIETTPEADTGLLRAQLNAYFNNLKQKASWLDAH